MDIQQERRQLDAALATLPSLLQPRFKSQFEELAARHAALPAGDPSLPSIEQRIDQLQRDVLSSFQPNSDWSTWARIGLGITILGIFVLYGLYFAGLPDDKYASIEGTRPVLVFTLIISMLGFGGVLIARALYGAQGTGDDLQTRFRMAREVFLVFAGIFGTIIGFYFGAADADDGRAETPVVEIAFAESKVTATVAGGAEPFTGIFTPAGATGGQLMAVDDRVLTFAPSPAACPQGATVLVIDGRGRRGEGTVSCGGAGTQGNPITPPAPDPAPNTSAGNASDATVANKQ